MDAWSTPSPITHRLGPDAFEVTSPAAAVAWLRRLGWVKVRRSSKDEYARLSLLKSTASIGRDGLVVISHTHRRAA